MIGAIQLIAHKPEVIVLIMLKWNLVRPTAANGLKSNDIFTQTESLL